MKKTCLRWVIVGGMIFLSANLSLAAIPDTYNNAENTETLSNSVRPNMEFTANLSPNVFLMYVGDGAGGNAYIMGTVNDKGSKTYGAAHNEEAIAEASFDNGTQTLGATLPDLNASWGEGWTAIGGGVLPASMTDAGGAGGEGGEGGEG